MNPTYLSSLQLKGFRGYTNSAEVTFPTGPGLTVIVGPNGLGKSTLFDAIEWGLTGELKRVKSIDARDREKEKSLGKEPFVQLTFEDETTITRTRREVRIGELKGEEHIAAWLVNQKWRGMKGIADCLHFTHFLGQSTRQLFVHQEGKERWARLEGPTGLQTLWSVEQTLGRNQTTNAFSKLEKELEARLANVHNEQRQLSQLLDSLQQQQDLARAGSAISPEEIHERVYNILTRVSLDFGIDTGPPSHDIDALLKQLIRCLERISSIIYTEKSKLDECEGIFDQYRQLKLVESQTVKLLESCLEKTGELDRVSAKEHEQELHLKRAVESADQNVASLKNDVIRFESAIRRKNEIEELVAARDFQARSILDLQNRIGLLDDAILNRHKELASVSECRHKYEALLTRERSLAELLRGVEQYERAHRDLDQARLDDAILSETRDRVLLDRDIFELELTRSNAVAEKLHAQWSEARLAVDAIAGAVAQIATALTNQDCECPVCKKHFDSEGELKLIARRSSEQSDERLAILASEREAAFEAVKAAREKLGSTERVLRDLDSKRGIAAHLAAQVEQLEIRLRSNPFLAPLHVTQFYSAVGSEIAKVSDEAAAVRLEIAKFPGEADIAARLAALKSERDAVVTEHRNIRQSEEATAVRLALLQDERNARDLTFDDDLSGSLVSVQLELEQAIATAMNIRGEFESVTAAFVRLKEQIIEANGAVDVAREKLETVRSKLNELVMRWREYGFENEPDSQAITKKVSWHSERISVYHHLKLEHEVLLEGRRQYVSQQILQRLELDLRTVLQRYGVSSVSELQNSLDREVSTVRAELDNLHSVRNKRDSLLVRLRERNNDIRNHVGAPLNVSVGRFCESLMSDREFELSVDAIANAASAEALLSFQHERLNDGDRKNPLLYMSEGQLAAVSLCLLFGASVTYPWSKWKALLLDDPLHHNDTVHASSFIDVIRNLILKRGYQIILSTHDLEQAGYFIRKCSNAGIKARYWHLYGRNEKGSVLMQNGQR